MNTAQRLEFINRNIWFEKTVSLLSDCWEKLSLSFHVFILLTSCWIIPKNCSVCLPIYCNIWDHISVQMVVFAHKMKQKLLNIMINRFTFVINNESGLNTESQENACPWFGTPLCPGAHPEYRCEVWNEITFRNNTKWNIFLVLVLNSGLNWDHRDLSFKMTTILGTNAMMLRATVTILSTTFGLYKGKRGLLGSHCPRSNSPRAVY